MMQSATLTPQEFVDIWSVTGLGERQSYQLHFLDVCRLVGYEAPTASGKDSRGNTYVFERSIKKDTGAQGFADVFYAGHFAVEYKAAGKHKDLKAAYDQLLQYREKLNNPPLLVVTDIDNWEIHTNFPNTEKVIYKFKNVDIATRPSIRDALHHLFYSPDRLHPKRNTTQVTADAAKVFKLIADNMRQWEAEPERIAHFLTKLVFCLFAEDVSLLPAGPKGETGIFSEIVERTRTEPQKFARYTQELFEAMADGGEVLFEEIPYFNGELFDDVRVEDISLEALTELEKAAQLNWSSIEPSIFGTLFERSLDPNKRSQLGAHYTSREDILLIVEPVLMQPLRREWEAILDEARPLREKFDSADNRRAQTTNANKLRSLRETMLNRLRTITVLDPACGSGNFLYVSLQLLMDMEKEVINHELWQGLERPFPEVHPRQMYGIEINPIAHALATIVVWIGYIQWRKNNGYSQAFREPILETLQDNILRKDAILKDSTYYIDKGLERGVEWKAVDVIVGNPPFLGDKKMRGELGDDYVEQLRDHYEGRVPGGADFVLYWFEQARQHIEEGKAKRAGLLATNSIRDGANREVLKRIKDTGDIFMAWSDREWVLDGAALRVSMVGFDDGSERSIKLDDLPVQEIYSNLTASVDITKAQILLENVDISFIGTQKGGAFDIDEYSALNMIENNPINREVVRPWVNAKDITARSRNKWIINFEDFSLETAKKYIKPLQYVIENVKPSRDKNRDKRSRDLWWQFQRSRPAMFKKLKGLSRYIATPMTAKHRLFVWLDMVTTPENLLVVFARDDDYFFGVLHSRLHEVWSLRMGSWLGKGNDPRYTPTTTFETFPFPWSPGAEDTNSPAYQAIAQAAKQLHEERDAWLNPPNLSEARLKQRTLTNLYNALAVFRGHDTMRTKPDANDFAPRLDELHTALDHAVCDAYGWGHDILEDEEAMLSHLLALNLERAEAQ